MNYNTIKSQKGVYTFRNTLLFGVHFLFNFKEDTMKFFEKGKNAAISVIIVGLIIFAMGLVGLGWFTFEETDYMKYGGDAYTGIQNAAADTANNVAKACTVLCSAIGFITSSFGAVFLNYFKMKEFEYIELNKKGSEGKQTYQCSKCKALVSYGAKKCDNCGSRLNWN